MSGVLEEHFFENGRRYCSESYYMPDDDEEQTRLAIAHQVYLPVLDGQLTMAHIPSDAKRILDIGTGTGDWAIAVAERFPGAEVIATDITTAFQPTIAPPNVFFELDDAQTEWTYSEPFDFIHMRAMSGAFSDWSTIFEEVSKHLRLGGYFEIVDHGMITLTEELPSSSVRIFNAAIEAGSEKAGRPIGLEHLKMPLIENSGLRIVKNRLFQIPLGVFDPQKRIVGKMALISTLEGLEAISLRLLTKYLHWQEEDVRDLCAKVREEVTSPNARAKVPCQYVVARKMM